MRVPRYLVGFAYDIAVECWEDLLRRVPDLAIDLGRVDLLNRRQLKEGQRLRALAAWEGVRNVRG